MSAHLPPPDLTGAAGSTPDLAAARAAGCPFAAAGGAQYAAQYAAHPRRRFGRPSGPAVRREIATLDARQDCQRIVHLLTAYEFPFDMLRSTEIALFHTYGSRSVARLLDRTREFADYGQKRYDDTRLLIAQFMETGWDDELGRRSIEQMNHIHSFFRIPNEDFLFVLWTFIDFPEKWMDDFGWRPFTAHEREAWFHFWCEIGRRMGMQDLPADKPAFDAFVATYEAREFVPNEHSQRVAQATVDIMANWFTGPLRLLRPMVAPVARCLLRPHLLPVVGMNPPSKLLSLLVHAALKLRGRAKRFMSLEHHPTMLADVPSRTYPGNSYRVEGLGPGYAHRDAEGRGHRDVA